MPVILQYKKTTKIYSNTAKIFHAEFEFDYCIQITETGLAGQFEASRSLGPQ